MSYAVLAFQLKLFLDCFKKLHNREDEGKNRPKICRLFQTYEHNQSKFGIKQMWSFCCACCTYN